MHLQISLCLSHDVNELGILSKDSLARIRKASEIFVKKKCDFMITTGWKSKNYKVSSLANIMADKAIKNFDIPKSKIYKEENCKDTVGEAIFSKILIYENFKFSSLDLHIISSDWHIKRVEEIFKFFYIEDNIKSIFYTIKGQEDQALKEQKNVSIEKFRSMMSHCEPGNTLSALEILQKKHKLYIQ